MNVQLARDLPVPAEDYLEGELHSEVKHEYLSGAVYAMAGGRNVHNEISGNIFLALGSRLRGKPCRPYNSDTKVRLPLLDGLRFYYPDVQVTCHPNPPNDSFQDQPVVVVEVISESTRRTDESEKREAYCALPSLQVYLLVETSRSKVTAHRRNATGFAQEIYSGVEAVVLLDCIEAKLPLAEIYERVVFSEADSE